MQLEIKSQLRLPPTFASVRVNQSVGDTRGHTEPGEVASTMESSLTGAPSVLTVLTDPVEVVLLLGYIVLSTFYWKKALIVF